MKFINSQQIFTELTHQLWFIQPRKLLATLDTELQCKDIKSTKTTNPKKANQNCFVVHVVCIYLVGPHGPRLMVFLFTLHTLYIYVFSAVCMQKPLKVPKYLANCFFKKNHEERGLDLKVKKNQKQLGAP